MKNKVPKSPLKTDTKIIKNHSFFENLTLIILYAKNGKSMIVPIKCSKNIIVTGGKEYKYLRITPSRAQSKAALITKSGPKLFLFICIILYLA